MHNSWRNTRLKTCLLAPPITVNIFIYVRCKYCWGKRFHAHGIVSPPNLTTTYYDRLDKILKQTQWQVRGIHDNISNKFCHAKDICKPFTLSFPSKWRQVPHACKINCKYTSEMSHFDHEALLVPTWHCLNCFLSRKVNILYILRALIRSFWETA